MITLKAAEAFSGILLTADFNQSDYKPKESLGHWFIPEGSGTLFKTVQGESSVCGITQNE